VLAETMLMNLHAYGTMLRIADDYERLADMADRENARNAPVQALPEGLVMNVEFHWNSKL